MAEKTTTAEISESGKSAYAVEIKVSGHGLTGDEPAESGGGNLGPSPYDMLTAALGECTVMTVRWLARQKNWPLEHVSARVTHKKVPAEEVGKEDLPPEALAKGGVIDLFEKTVTLKGDQLTPEQKQKLIAAAAKCPVQRTLEGRAVIKTSYA